MELPPELPPSSPEAQLAHRIHKMHKHRGKWARRQGISCYRVYDHEISDQPLIVDWYAGDAVVWAQRRTKDETGASDAVWLERACSAVCAGLGISDDKLWLKRRRQQEDRQHGGQYQPAEKAGHVKTVIEGGLEFEINLSDYLDVGLFLDHRPLRLRVGSESSGLDVLNLFAYTGAFSVHAAAGGARSTTTVDLSNTYLDWAGRNLVRNRLDAPQHQRIRSDCLAWLKDAAAAGPAYDLVVCDPPTFSNSSGMRGTWSIDRDHAWLLDACLAVLRPRGVLYFSTNSRHFVPDANLADIPEITAQTIPEDFTGKRPHRAWRLVK